MSLIMDSHGTARVHGIVFSDTKVGSEGVRLSSNQSLNTRGSPGVTVPLTTGGRVRLNWLLGSGASSYQGTGCGSALGTCGFSEETL